MVRKYVRRLGAKFRRDYPFEAMENALQAVVERGLSFRQAADECQNRQCTENIGDCIEIHWVDHLH
jgi:hypothetical protein